MKFKVDRLKDQLGEQRIITKFLLFPKSIGNDIRWLEKATILQEVMPIDVGGSMEWGNYRHRWVDVSFLPDQEKVNL